MFFEFPEVEIPRKDVARLPQGFNLPRKDPVVRPVVPNRCKDRGISRQRDCFQRRTIHRQAHHKLRNQVLCISRRAPVACHHQLPPSLHRVSRQLPDREHGRMQRLVIEHSLHRRNRLLQLAAY